MESVLENTLPVAAGAAAELAGGTRVAGELAGGTRGAGELGVATRAAGELAGGTRAAGELGGGTRAAGELGVATRAAGELGVAKPKWLKVKLPIGKKYTELRGLVDKYSLNTICTSGSCPNMGECWGEGTATFMILGNICTRSCGFCGVKTGRPETVDWDEPEKVARSIKIMNITHAVVTSVDRDDLKDMGSIIWLETIRAIRRMNPTTTLETLIPDFQGNERNIDRIIEANPEVVSHNMETVRRLTREVRIQAKYDRSLEVLRYLKSKGIRRTKSGIMLGLGETEAEVIQTMRDLRGANVDIVTIGQYLQPSKKHLPVKEFITPEQFEKYETIGKEMGFRHVESGALVRSSYKAAKHML